MRHFDCLKRRLELKWAGVRLIDCHERVRSAEDIDVSIGELQPHHTVPPALEVSDSWQLNRVLCASEVWIQLRIVVKRLLVVFARRQVTDLVVGRRVTVKALNFCDAIGVVER